MIRRPNNRLHLAVFLYRLPDALPFPDGATFSFELEEQIAELRNANLHVTRETPPVPWQGGHSFVSLRFWRTAGGDIDVAEMHDPLEEAITKSLPPQFHQENRAEPRLSRFERLRLRWEMRRLEDANLEPPESYVTVVEAVVLLNFAEGEETFSNAFDRALDKTADLVRAYRNFSHRPIHQLTRERLPPYALFLTRTLDEPIEWSEGFSLMLLHMNVSGVGADELSTSELNLVNQHLSVGLRRSPFSLFVDQAIESRVAFEVDGDYAACVVYAQTSSEILLDGLLTFMLWEEGTSPAEAATLFDDGLAKRVRSHFGLRLGGNWNPSASNVISAWAQHVAHVRGRVVHGGYRPTIQEARNARNAMTNLEDFIKDRLAERRATYPRTTLSVLGRPGLERRGLWSGQIQRFAERDANTEPDWLASYWEWREQLDSRRNP